jgi:Nif-specific regulatory protein
MLDSASNIDFPALLDFATVLNRQTDFNETLRLVADKTSDVLDAESVSIMMFNPSTHETVKTVFRRGKKVTVRAVRSLQSQLTGWMLHNQPSLISDDIRQDSRFENLDMSLLSVQCAIGVLLKIETSIMGSIVVFRAEKANPIAESDLPVLEYIAAIAAPYLRNMEEIRRFFAPSISQNALLKKYNEVGLIGASQEFIELLHAIEAGARCDVRVVLEGESGTGKELIARAIHRFSDRKARPFIAVDCGAISENLLESELFGHKKGAFTGASQDRKGMIEEADHGTLFIDEIADLPLDMQMKFMRFLQEGEVRPVGTNIPKKVNVRIVSASSQSLRKLVQDGRFRQDLFFRLHVYPIYVPALRDRGKDIALLADHFLAIFSKRQGKNLKSFHADALRFMRKSTWKGNIRELENFVERLVTLTSFETTMIEYDSFPDDLQDEFNGLALNQETDAVNKSLKERLAASEERIIRQALIENNWNQSQAARSLRISEQIIRYRMKKLGITRPE